MAVVSEDNFKGFNRFSKYCEYC